MLDAGSDSVASFTPEQSLDPTDSDLQKKANHIRKLHSWGTSLSKTMWKLALIRQLTAR